jgi:hypothetical protein
MALPPEPGFDKSGKRVGPVKTGSRSDGEVKKHIIPKTPSQVRDVKSAKDLNRAEKFKKTPQYRHDVTRAYESAPLPARQAAVARAQHVFSPSVEQAAVLHTHAARMARNEELARSRAQHDIPSNTDIALAGAIIDYHKRQKEGGGLLGTIRGASELGAKIAATSLFPNVALALKGLDIAGIKGPAKTANEVVANVGRELIDIPANLPASIYRLGSVAAPGGAPGGIPKAVSMTAQSYVELYHHPGQFAKNNPVSTVLMLSPLVKTPLRVIGTRGEIATLGTTGVEDIMRGKGIRGRQEPTTRPMTSAEQKRYGIGRGEVQRRVDEAMAAGWGSGHLPSEVIGREFSHKDLTTADNNFPMGKPVVKTNQESARRLAVQQAKKQGMEYEPFRWGEKNGQEYWVAVPKDVASRYMEHITIGGRVPSSFSTWGKQFRQVVLGTSPKWMTGNILEATFRSLVSRSGLIDYVAAKRILKRMDQQVKEGTLEAWKRDEFKARTIAGGHYHLAGTSVADLAKGAHEIAEGNPKGLSRAWSAYTRFVFETVNGRVESQFQTAMLGQALRNNRMIPRGMAFRSKAAMDEAIQGLKNTNHQVKLGRDIDRMYGRYGKFSPREKYLIGTFTPFIAWTKNAIDFLYHVLPTDHPVLTAAIAAQNQITEEWRKSVGQFTGADAHTPGYLQGSVPSKKKGELLRLGHYIPSGVFQSETGLFGTLADAVIPQYASMIDNLKGTDWKGDKLAYNGQAVPFIAAVVSAIEQQIPFVRYADAASGVRLPNMSKSKKIEGTPLSRLRQQANPFTTIAPSKGGKDKSGLLNKYGFESGKSTGGNLLEKYGYK